MRDRSALPARTLLAATILALGAYVLWQGVGKFYDEALGTWILSPLICLRLSPAPLHNWLLQMPSPLLCGIVCLVPVLMLAGAFLLGVWAYYKGCLSTALLAVALTVTVFGVYHAVKHLGLQVVELPV